MATVRCSSFFSRSVARIADSAHNQRNFVEREHRFHTPNIVTSARPPRRRRKMEKACPGVGIEGNPEQFQSREKLQPLARHEHREARLEKVERQDAHAKTPTCRAKGVCGAGIAIGLLARIDMEETLSQPHRPGDRAREIGQHEPDEEEHKGYANPRFISRSMRSSFSTPSWSVRPRNTPGVALISSGWVMKARPPKPMTGGGPNAMPDSSVATRQRPSGLFGHRHEHDN